MSGIDSMALYIQMALGNEVEPPVPAVNNRVAVMEFLELNPGKVKKIKGIRCANEIKGIVEVVMNVKPGDQVYPPSDDRSRHGHIMAYADELDELESLVADVKRMIVVEYE
jgi:hypothetical protein